VLVGMHEIEGHHERLRENVCAYNCVCASVCVCVCELEREKRNSWAILEKSYFVNI
jgi:hypothetical protein